VCRGKNRGKIGVIRSWVPEYLVKMSRSDLKHMNMHDFLIYIFLLLGIATLGSLVIVRLIRMLSLTREERDLEIGKDRDIVELGNYRNEQRWRGEIDSLLYPRGC